MPRRSADPDWYLKLGSGRMVWQLIKHLDQFIQEATFGIRLPMPGPAASSSRGQWSSLQVRRAVGSAATSVGFTLLRDVISA